MTDPRPLVPLAFHDCAGWLHLPPEDAERAHCAFVLAPAHGFEELSSRRAMRILADALAQAGAPALRFDWHGTGQSLGGPCDPDRLAHWRADLNAAMETVRQATGATEIGLIGLRLGALLAADAIARGADVGPLALLAPPASGRAYGRQLRALARVMETPDKEDAAAFDGILVAGLPTGRATLEALASLEIPADFGPRNVLIVDGAEGAPAGNARVTKIAAAGFEKMLCDPTASEVPFPLIEKIVSWAHAQMRPARNARPIAKAPAPARLACAEFYEEQLVFGPQRQWAATLCAPHGQDEGAPILFLNAGGAPRSGWARMTSDHARALAAKGVASLRIDLPGVGDSRGDDAKPRPDYYNPQMIEAAAAALDAMEARGWTRMRVYGACSGAYAGLHLARRDPRVCGLMMVNLQLFAWDASRAAPLAAWMNSRAFDIGLRKRREDEELGDFARLQAKLAAGALALAKTSARNGLRAMRAAMRRAQRASDGASNLGDEAQGWLADLSARKVKTRFVFGEGDSGLAEIAAHFGPGGVEALGLPHISQSSLGATDHAVTPKDARARLLTEIMGWAEVEREALAQRA